MKQTLLVLLMSTTAYAAADCYQEDRIFKHCVNQRELFDQARARAHGRDVLLVVGHDGCPWSRAMVNLLERSTKAAEFRARYEIQAIAASKTNLTGRDLIIDLMRAVGQDPAEALKAVPLLLVVGPDGKLIRAVPTADFERNEPEGKWYGHDLDKVAGALLR